MGLEHRLHPKWFIIEIIGHCQRFQTKRGKRIQNSQQTKPDVFKWNVQGNWAIMFISARSWVDSKTTHFSIVLNDRLIRYNFNELLWRPIASNFQFSRKNERKESCSSLIYNRSILNEIWQATEKRTLASCSSQWTCNLSINRCSSFLFSFLWSSQTIYRSK